MMARRISHLRSKVKIYKLLFENRVGGELKHNTKAYIQNHQILGMKQSTEIRG